MDAYDRDNRIDDLETEMRVRGLTDDEMRELRTLRTDRD
jgi:hypothetical protein